MKNVRTSSHENGVALIFALGLLTLLSVLGVAFVTNSLTAQKIAANVGAVNDARILMDSAVNRVMISLMTVLRQDKSASDYSIIYSTNDGNPRSPSGALETRDQLDDADNSKLNVFLTGQPRYDGSKSKAAWVYLRDDAGNVVGRMAYQVLPTGTSSMSLDQVLKGVYNPDNGNAPGAGSPSAWAQRIGRDIREFNIGQAHNAPASFNKEWKYDAEAGAHTGYDDMPENSGISIVSSFDDFFQTEMFKKIIAGSDADVNEKRQVWLRRWFSESANASPEVFYYAGSDSTKMEEATAYHRFNLGPLSGTVTDAWYSRFKGFDAKSGGDADMKNSVKVIDELFKKSEVFYPEDNATPQGSGLPYLTKICADKGSFADVETRRRQIAANLNDYCDSDSIPTSDVSAAEWSNDKMPAYTGNEKTPYINEFVLGLKLKCEKDSSSKGNIKVTMTPQLLTELIKIYDAGTAASYQPWLRNIGLNVKVYAKGKATYKFFVFTWTSDFNKEYEFDSLKITDDESVFPSTASMPDLSSGYGVIKQEKTASTVVLNMDQKIGLTAESGGNVLQLTKIDYETVEIRVKSISFDFSCAVLRDSTGNGVDFVRGPGTVVKDLGESPLSLALNNSTLKFSDAGADDTKVVYLSGMEARDPRQNLNFNKAETTGDFKADASDWKCVPTVQAKSTESATEDIGSITIDGSGNPSGKVNSCSNPSAPFSVEDKFNSSGAGDPGTDYDRETVADPAWLGVNADQHVSTAYIRNAPMQSLWELGVIHRGSAWETINIKGAAGGTPPASPVSPAPNPTRRINLMDNTVGNKTAAGIPYAWGDGIILDQTKLTGQVYTSGKLDVNMLLKILDAEPADPKDSPGYPVAWDKNIVKALFCGLRYGQQLGDIYTTPVSTTSGTAIEWNGVSDSVVTYAKTVPAGGAAPNTGKYVSRADFVEGSTDPASGDPRSTVANAFGLVSGWSSLADAQQEEIVGKTANLLTAGATAPTTIQAVVIVQTIKSIDLPSAGTAVVIRQAYKKDGTPVTQSEVTAVSTGVAKNASVTANPAIDLASNGSRNFRFGSFTDSDGKTRYVYFDEITGELRALVTIKLVRDSGGAMRFQLHNVRYL